MKKRLKFIISVLLLAGLTGSGIFLYLRSPISAMGYEDALHYIMHEPAVRRVMELVGLREETVLKGKKIYWCPMHPQVKRDRPGLCPICNMQLVEMEEEKKGREDVLVFTDRQVQQSGARTEKVRTLALTYEIDTTGRVDVDERLIKKVSNRVKGRSRIERLHVNFTGDRVEKGAPLVTLYSPDLVTTQEEYLMVLSDSGPWARTLIEAAEVRLRRWGLTGEQIEGIKKRGRPIEEVTIHSPISGTVMERLVAEGQYVEEGQDLLELADLSRVWIYGDVYEYEIPFIRTGMAVEVSPEGIPGRTIRGRIDFIDPVVQSESRTVRVRFEVDNPEGLLRPGMYARVRMKTGMEKVLAVPASAVLLTGRRAVVIVSEGKGLMRPQEVKLGRKWLHAVDGEKKKNSFLDDDERYHEVLSGLKEGQEVVVAGNFLIAAEAGFQGVLKKMLPPEEEKKETEKLSKELEASFARILESYEKIRKALAGDDTGPVGDIAKHLSEDIKKTIAISGGDFKEALEELLNLTKGLSRGPEDIKEVRTLFSSMSRIVISLAGRYGLPPGVELHPFVCPMAGGYGGWLQKGADVENPYLGQKMPGCGNPLSLKGAPVGQ